MSDNQSIVDNLRWARKTITGIQLQLHGFEEIPSEDVNYATRQGRGGIRCRATFVTMGLPQGCVGRWPAP